MINPRQAQREGAASARTLAICPRFAAMPARDRAHNEKAQTGAFYLVGSPAGHAIKTFEDALQLGSRDSHTIVAHLEQDRIHIGRDQINFNRSFAGCVFDGIFQQVGHSGAEFFLVAQQSDVAWRFSTEMQFLGFQSMAQASQLNAFLHDGGKINVLPVSLAVALPDFSGFQNLLNRAQEPVRIFEHETVEIMAAAFIHLTPLQGFKVKPDGGDGSLQFVRDRVQEAVLLLIAADFAHKKNGIQNHARDDHEEEDDAENQRHHLAPVEHDPGDVEKNGQSHQAGAQRDEECHRLGPAGDTHG